MKFGYTKNGLVLSDKISSILDLLHTFGMLESEFEVLLTSLMPRELIKYLPYVLYTDTVEAALISKECKNLDMLKSRAHNYYCDRYIKNVVSVFGNEKAWQEFGVTKAWRPKISYIRDYDVYRHWGIYGYRTSLIKLVSYKRIYDTYSCKTCGIIMCLDGDAFLKQNYVLSLFSDNTIGNSSQYSLLLSKIASSCSQLRRPERRSRRRISMLVNRKDISGLKYPLMYLKNLESVLTEDGQELIRDLSFVKNIA